MKFKYYRECLYKYSTEKISADFRIMIIEILVSILAVLVDIYDKMPEPPPKTNWEG